MTAQSKELQETPFSPVAEELQKIEEVRVSVDAKKYIEDEKKLDELIQTQAMMQEMMQQLADQRKEINRLNEVALKKSIEFENMKKELEGVTRLKFQLVTSNIHLFKFLEEIEGRFDADEKFDSPEICRDYIDAALYCQKYFGRINNRLTEAQTWYNSLMPWEQTDKLK